jgi:hypothetical protein
VIVDDVFEEDSSQRQKPDLRWPMIRGSGALIVKKNFMSKKPPENLKKSNAKHTRHLQFALEFRAMSFESIWREAHGPGISDQIRKII